MAGVVVLDVADDIWARLGEPTVTALAQRFGPEGRCLTCDGDPGRLAADPAQFEYAIANGGVLLGWAPLRG